MNLVFIRIQDIDWVFCRCGELADWYQILDNGYRKIPFCSTCKEELEDKE